MHNLGEQLATNVEVTTLISMTGDRKWSFCICERIASQLVTTFASIHQATLIHTATHYTHPSNLNTPLHKQHVTALSQSLKLSCPHLTGDTMGVSSVVSFKSFTCSGSLTTLCPRPSILPSVETWSEILADAHVVLSTGECGTLPATSVPAKIKG